MKGTQWLGAALVLVAACAGEDAAEVETIPETPAAEVAAPAATAGVTDPQIAAIVVAANDVDIEAGRLASERATDEEVKAFADRMVTDHTAVNEQAVALVTRLGVTPETNPTSEALAQGGQQNRAALEGLTGAEFDRTYVDQEVAYHQQVLDAIDGTLIPGATNAELRTLLEQTRPAVAAHLDHARTIQTRLGN